MEIYPAMDSITISNVDDDLKRRLKERAAEHGHSIEFEVRDILRAALVGSTGETAPVPGNLGDAIRAIVEPLGGIELDIPQRKPVREPPKFS
jgi:antitoxin FitA